VANASAAPSGTSAKASATDSVQITDTASYLVTAEQALSDVPVVNSGRVTEISDSLAAGTYEISPERIANQLLQFERLLPEESVE
jgi:negative regulator of flagellin synthesis FlgM